jgi:hypothetical protein
MTRHAITLVPFLLLSSTAHSQQQSNTATYYCGAEWAGGGRFNSATGRWEGIGFNPNSLDYKFILKVRRVRNALDALGQLLGPEYASYNITITPSGVNPTVDCLAGAYPSQVVIARLGRIKCDTELYEYAFSLDFNRFLQVYTGAYLNSNGSKDDTPSISGGTCAQQR